VQIGLSMKTIAPGLALTLASLAFVAIGVGCAADPPPTYGSDDDDVKPTKKKAPSEDEQESKTKSDTNAPAPPLPAPTTTTTAPPAAPPPPPPVDTTPKVDPQACSNLANCCSKITNVYGQLACVAVQLRGDPETCSKSLIACLATVGLGGGTGTGTGCIDDTDCPGTQICVNRVCK
jgi:hypothetical protein